MFGAGVEDTLVNSEHGAAYSSASLEVMCGAMTHSSHRIERQAMHNLSLGPNLERCVSLLPPSEPTPPSGVSISVLF